MKTKLKKRGTNTLEAEVSHISAHGIWVLAGEKEYHLGFEDYPVFGNARVNDLLSVELLHGRHLRWNALDVDIELESLDDPAGYPLIYR
jgi:hypothetical protein